MSKKSSITLRRIQQNDLEWARVLRNKNKRYFFDNNYINADRHRKWYKNLNYPFFIIEYNRLKVGTIAVRKRRGQIYLNNVLIDESHRGKNILSQVILLLRKKYKLPFYVEVLVENQRAIAVYKKLGFDIFALLMRNNNT